MLCLFNRNDFSCSFDIKTVMLEFWNFADRNQYRTMYHTYFCSGEDSNKPLDELEVKVYRKKSYQFAIVDICLFMIAAVLNQQRMYETVALSILSLGILVLIGKIEDSFHQNEKHDGR